jgi:hypothetical protein
MQNQNGGMIDDYRTVMKLKGRGRAPVEILTQHFPRGTEQTAKNRIQNNR